MFSGIEITPHTIDVLIMVFVIAVLLFDLCLLLFTKNQMTISRGIVRSKWYWQLLVCFGLTALLFHLWG
jgi:hypothetical protein